MKFLVDAQLPRRLVLRLREAGHDAVHISRLLARMLSSIVDAADLRLGRLPWRCADDKITTTLSLCYVPNDWNGETLCVELPDVYRLPDIVQISRQRPRISPPRYLSGSGWVPIPAGTSRVKTIDVSKWKLADGWGRGKYQILVRVDKIDVDRYTWMSSSSDPIVIEIK